MLGRHWQQEGRCDDLLECYAEDDEAENDYSLRSCYMKGEDGAAPSGQVGAVLPCKGLVLPEITLIMFLRAL